MKVDNILTGHWQNLLEVKRFGTTNMSVHLSVAEHSWLTAMLVGRFMKDAIKDNYLYRCPLEMVGDISRNALHSALIHDIEECLISDIPNISFTRNNILVKDLKADAILEAPALLFDDPLDSLGYGFDRASAKIGVDGMIVSYADAYSMLIELNRQRDCIDYSDILNDVLDILDANCEREKEQEDYYGTNLGHFYEGMSNFFKRLTTLTKEFYAIEKVGYRKFHSMVR